MKYKASMDQQTKASTIAVTIIMLLAVGSCFVIYFDAPHISLLVTAFLLTGIYFLIFSARPVYYRVTNESIQIHRLIGTKEIKRIDINSTTLISKDAIAHSYRTFGVGGLFGHFGKFYNAKLGEMQWYLTRRDKPLLIETTKGIKFLLSPDNPEAFLAAL